MHASDVAQAYDTVSATYDDWYDEHPALYRSELAAVRSLLPPGRILEIGVGTGAFAVPLHIACGIDPSHAMISIANRRGVSVVRGVGEALPFRRACFDVVLFVTAFCFLEQPGAVLDDVARVLKKDGALVIAFIDKNGSIARSYEAKKAHNPAYRYARFYGPDDLAALLAAHGFTVTGLRQTIFDACDPAVEQEPRDGSGDGNFVVLRARFTDRV